MQHVLVSFMLSVGFGLLGWSCSQPSINGFSATLKAPLMATTLPAVPSSQRTKPSLSNRQHTNLSRLYALWYAVGAYMNATHSPNGGDLDRPTEGATLPIDDGSVTAFDQPFRTDYLDLNDDGIEDALVLLTEPEWCTGGGCTLLVLKGGRIDAFYLVSGTTSVQAPIWVAETRTNGWRDLIVEVGESDGSVVPVLLQFDGRSYPLDPVNQPPFDGVVPEEREVLSPVSPTTVGERK